MLLMSVAVHSAELASFDDIRSQYQSYKDPTRVSYLYNRCAALQLNVSALLARKGQGQGSKDFEDYSVKRYYFI